MTNTVIIAQHLTEVRYRLLYLIVSWTITLVSYYWYKDTTLYLFTKPFIDLDNVGHLIYTSPTEAFMVSISIAFVLSTLTMIPVIYYQIWSFLTPGLYKHEKKELGMLLITSTLLLFISTYITQNHILPKIWNFFLQFQLQENPLLLHMEPRITEYVTTHLQILSALMMLFQLPTLAYVITKYNLINIYNFSSKRKIIYVLGLLFATLVSPPDIFSQLLIWCLILCIVEITVIVLLMTRKNGDNRS